MFLITTEAKLSCSRWKQNLNIIKTQTWGKTGRRNKLFPLTSTFLLLALEKNQLLVLSSCQMCLLRQTSAAFEASSLEGGNGTRLLLGAAPCRAGQRSGMFTHPHMAPAPSLAGWFCTKQNGSLPSCLCQCVCVSRMF